MADLGYAGLPEMQDFARGRARQHAGLSRPVPLVGASALVMRRTAVDRLGGYDPLFPTGTLESADLCLRLPLRSILLVAQRLTARG